MAVELEIFIESYLYAWRKESRHILSILRLPVLFLSQEYSVVAGWCCCYLKLGTRVAIGTWFPGNGRKWGYDADHGLRGCSNLNVHLGQYPVL